MLKTARRAIILQAIELQLSEKDKTLAIALAEEILELVDTFSLIASMLENIDVTLRNRLQ